MKTVGKALSILDVFSERQPAWTLTEIARSTGLDRATCFRMLKVLEGHGYLTKDAAKRYALGATVLRLARTREAVSPVTGILQAAVGDLAQRTGETAHASLIAGNQVATVAVCDGLRPTRVAVEHAGTLELHATATGLACLAFADDAFLRHALSSPLARHTPATLVEPVALEEELGAVRRRGYSVADRTYDAEVVGVGAPLYGADDRLIGAIAVATPASRMDAGQVERVARAVMDAARDVSRDLGSRAHRTVATREMMVG